MDRLFRSVVGALVLLILLSFGLRLLRDLLQGGAPSIGRSLSGSAYDNPIVAIVVLIFLIGLGVRLTRAVNSRSSQHGQGRQERRAARHSATEVPPWSSPRKRRRPHEGRHGRGKDA
jgi:hypothetical protein